MNLKERKIDINNIMLDIQMILERITTIEDYIKKEQKVESTPIDPGEGYRLLEENELIKAGDESLSLCGAWGETVIPGSFFESNIHVPIRRKIDTHKYIESTDDIEQWQYYITPKGGVCKIYRSINSGFGFYIYDIQNNCIRPGFDDKELLDLKLRVAKIEETPDKCLIGKVVRASFVNEDKVGYNGVVIRKTNIGFMVCDFEDGEVNDYQQIELIDHPANY